MIDRQPRADELEKNALERVDQVTDIARDESETGFLQLMTDWYSEQA